MDVQSIFEAGGTIIKNPNYVKGRKNTQPEYITVADLHSGVEPTGSAVADFVYNAAASGRQDILGRNGELDKYIEAGLTPNDWQNLDKDLAESQSALSKFRNAIAQTLISEVALGTGLGISNLVDIIGQATGISSPDYTNPVSQYLEEKQEEFRNWAPIYTTPGVNISNGGLTDAGWWASNIPSVMSSLTLLIPAAGTVKGISMLGSSLNVGSRLSKAASAISGASKKAKAVRAAKAAGASAEEIAAAGKLNAFQRFITSPSTAKTTQLFLENTSTAVLSRALENYQESRQTYNDMYAEASEYFKSISDEEYYTIVYSNKDMLKREGVDPNDRDAVAAAIAKESADRTFQMDWANVAFDVIQVSALRNAWKGIKNAPTSSAKIRRKNLDEAKYFGKTEDEIKAIKKQRGFTEKAKEWVEDKLYASKFVIGAQLSEGAEEAINHIASQEGMHLGNVLLNKEKGNREGGFWSSWNDVFDNRISDYAKAPELWDAAFWGVMGGIVFQGLGSKFNQIKNKIGSKDEASDEAKSKLPWYKLEELPETKRRLADIQARQTDFQDYKEQLERINNNIDIENSTDDNQVEFESVAAQNVAREKLKNEFITNMTLRAMRNGNLDLLKAYLANDNVRKGMIEAGMFGPHEANMSAAEIEADSKKYTEEVLNKVEEIERMYDEELVAVNDMAASINASNSRKNQIDANYVQIIATNNIHSRLNLRDNEKERIAVDERIGELESLYSDELDNNINHAENIRLGIFTSELGKLRAKRRKLLEKEGDNLSTQVALHNIDKQIKDIEDKITDSAQLQWATFQSLRYTQDDNGNITQGTDEKAEAEAFAYRDAMIVQAIEDNEGNIVTNDVFEKLGLSDRAKTQLGMADIGRYNTLEQDSQKSFQTVAKISPELNGLYQTKAALELENNYYRSRISRTYDEVAYEAGILHNTMNEARKKAINEAYDEIARLYNKYGQPIEDLIANKFYGNNPNAESTEFLETISQQDKDTLNFYLDVLALDKGHNKALALSIVDRFRKERSLRKNDIDNPDNSSTKEEEEIEESESGSSKEGELEAKIPPITNPSAGSNNSAEDAENGQSSEESAVEDPQKIDNRTPSYYANFRNNKGNLISYNHKSEDNGSAAIYDNGDGTFTIDVRDNAKLKNDERMFSNANSVDLTRPHTVVTKPIAKRNNKGKLEIIQKGELTNTDTLEYQQKQAQEGQEGQPSEQTTGGQQAPSAPAEEENNGQARQAGGVPSIPSTGEGDNPSTPPAAPNPPAAPAPAPATKKEFDPLESIWNDAPQADVIYNTALTQLFGIYRNDNSTNLDDAASTIIEEHIKGGVDRTTAESAVNKALGVVKRLIERKTNAKAKSFNSSVDELIMSQATMLTSDGHKDAISAYQAAVQDMIKYYAKEFGLNQINGKYYINLENLLRYINQSTKDSSLANALYDSLKAYLTSEEGSKLYAITDSSVVTRDEAISNITKNRLQRLKEKLAPDNQYRINISDIIDAIDNNGEEDKEIIDTFNSLNVGDKLTFKVVDNKIKVFAPNGKQIGTMTIPRRGSTSGSFLIYQTGWKYDLIKTNGEVRGNIKQVLSNWLNAKTGAAKEINDIIRELAYGKPSDERKKELYKKFEENEEFKRAKSLGLVADKATTKELADGLIGIWRYTEIDETMPAKIQEVNKRESINSWFEKLHSDFTVIEQIKLGREVEMTVSTLNEGELVTVSAEEALPASKALAGGANPDTYKVIMGNPRVMNDAIVSGKGHTSGINIPQNHTGVLIPTLSGKPVFAYALAADTTSEQLGQDAKDIVKALHDEVDRLLKEFTENPSNKSYQDLYDFVESIIAGSRGISSLFRGLWFDPYVVNGEIVNFGIRINKDNEIKFYKNSNRGGFSTRIRIKNPEFDSKTVSISSKEAHTAIHEMLNNLIFRVDASYLDSDNVADKPINGIASKHNGKFVIKIGDKTWEYNSYNEFLLLNDVLSLTTKPNENGTSNFASRASASQKNNIQLKVSITDKSQSPVEGMDGQSESTESTSQPIAGLSVTQKVANILKSTSEQKGLDILEAVAGTIPTINETVIKSFKDLKLLPKSIIFDENFNAKGSKTEDYNAKVDKVTGVVTVGQVWMNLFNNPSTRGRAIRVLIHEQLHNKLRKNIGYVRSAKGIYNEFKYALENNKVQGTRTEAQLAHLREYLFESYENEDIALEEFLVESLTNEELARALNDIDAQVPTKKGKNLFQKILELMSKVFGWDVRKGSLYEKELKTIRDISKTATTTTRKTKSNRTVKNVQGIQLTLFDEEASSDTEVDNSTDTSNTSGTQETKTNSEQQVKEKEPEKPIDLTDEASSNENNEVDDDGFTNFVDDDAFDDFDSTVTEMLYPAENDYTSEMQAIKQQAIADGSFMKAPNGNPTNLTERQWLQVRTKNFINWFGDWINNPAEASKVVDENGEPLVVYHTTKAEIAINDGFSTFTLDQETAKEKHNIHGIFHTNSYKMSRSYVKDNKYYFETEQQLEERINKEVNVIAKAKDRIITTENNRTNNDYAIELGYTGINDTDYIRMLNYRIEALNNDIRDAEKELTKLDNIKKNFSNIKYTYSDFLNIKNPRIINGNNVHWNELNNDGLDKKDIDKLNSDRENYREQLYKETINNNKNLFTANDLKLIELGAISADEILDENMLESIDSQIDKKYPLPSFKTTNDIVDEAKLNGYDGVIFKNIVDYGGYEFITESSDVQVVFNPNQIKSATDNTGEFSTTNDDIRYSSVTELPSIQAFSERLPIAQQADFVSAVASADISVSCR